MPKYVPEIRISVADNVRQEYDSHSECAMSDVATDYETLETSYSQKPKAFKLKVDVGDDDVLLTDVDGSSDEEKETESGYPIDCINSILDLGMSCEEVNNSQGPHKRQKSIICSLERAKPRALTQDRFEDGGTDVEGMYMSEDEDEYKIDSDVDVSEFEPNAFVSIADKVVTGVIVSPSRTPEPGAPRKKSQLRSPVPISSVLTDTEMIISDTESNTSRSRKITKVRPFKPIGGFTSDTEESDGSEEHSSRVNMRQCKKISSSRSLDTLKRVSVIKSNMLAPVKKGSDCEQSLTDTEHIYLEECNPIKSQNRPSVIKMNQSQGNHAGSTIRHRQNAVKSKNNASPQSNQPQKTNKYPEKTARKIGLGLNVPIQEDDRNATDVEAFGSDSDDQMEEVKPVAYLPNAKCEMVIDNESHKGKMSFILPITDSQKNKTLRVDDLDCGYSDVEDLPDYEPEEDFKYSAQDVPRHTYMSEQSLVENRDIVIDRSKLSVDDMKPEPLTDTEELDLPVKRTQSSQLKVKLPQRARKISECHTDVEDLEGSDNENCKKNLTADPDPGVQLTDVGDLTSEESDEGIYRFTAITPDLELNETYTTAREAMSPFSIDVKKQINNTIPKIRTISPSPIPRNHTDVEDFCASQESAGSNWDYSDEGNIESHSSVVHIKHTRKFNNNAEKDHIKGFINRPDPTTDVEELTMLEALEELTQKKRKHQKTKEHNKGKVETCFNGSKGAKMNSRGYKSASKHDTTKGAGKSKEAVDSSWLSQREGESIEGEFSQEGSLKNPYDNIGGIYYKEMADQSVYPPHLGYYEFECDALGSNSSLARGTDTFSELLFSSSNSESEEPDDNFPLSREHETCGILYDMSSHINKVPDLLMKKTKVHHGKDVFRDSPENSLESRLKYYHELCNRSLSPEMQGISSAERAELRELEESISQMLIEIRHEESLFYNNKQEDEDTNTIKRRPKREKNEERGHSKIDSAGEHALKEIESHISKLLQDVEKEEREVMGSLKRDFKRSREDLEDRTLKNVTRDSEKLKEGEDMWQDFKSSLEKLETTWDMINATCGPEEDDVQYVPFRDSSYTPSPVESSSTSEDEYKMVPKVKLNVGNRLGRSTIDIFVKNSPVLRRKSKMTATRRSLNRSLPSLKPSSVSLALRDHNSTECLLEPSWRPSLWQPISVEYIAPPEHIEPDSGYCIWSYPDEEAYGKEPKATEERDRPTEDEPKTQDTKIVEQARKGKADTAKKDKPSLSRKESGKKKSPEKCIDVSKKVIQKQTSASEKEIQKKKSPSPEKEVSKKKTPSPEKEVLKKKLPSPEKDVSKKKLPSPEKEVKKKPPSAEKEELKKKSPISDNKSTDQTAVASPKPHEDKHDEKLDETVKTPVTDKGKGKSKKEKPSEKQQSVEDKIKKKTVESKGPLLEKKPGLLGKTLETIKKPFQDKGEDKAQKDKGKGKGKGKDKSLDSMKSSSQDSSEGGKSEAQSSNGEELKLSGDISCAKKVDEAAHSTMKTENENREREQEDGKHSGKEGPEKESIDKKINEGKIERLQESSQLEIAIEPLLEKTAQEKTKETSTSSPISQDPSGGKGKEKRKADSVKSEKSHESKDVKDPKGKDEQLLQGKDDKDMLCEKICDKGKQKGKKEGEPSVQTVEKHIQKKVSIEATSPLQKESSPELEDEKKRKAKDDSSSESKTRKSEPSVRNTDEVKPPHPSLDHNAQVSEPIVKKEGKGKQQKPIDSAKSLSIEKEAEPSGKLDTEREKTTGTKPETTPQDGTRQGKESKDKVSGKQSSPDKSKLPSQEKGKVTGKQTSLEKSKLPAQEKAKSKSPEKPKSTLPEDTKASSADKSKPNLTPEKPKSVSSEKPTPSMPSKEGKGTTDEDCKSPTKGEKKKGKGKNKQKPSPDPPTKEKEEPKKAKTGKKQTLEKQPTIEKAVEIVTKTFIETPEMAVQREVSPTVEKLMKELSQEESGQAIEGKPIELVTVPFVSGSVSQDTPQVTKTEKLIKELSLEKSGDMIEKEAIDLVAKPLQDMKLGSSQTTEHLEKSEKNEFELIQKTIDDAMFKLEQFKGIVMEQTEKQPVVVSRSGEITESVTPRVTKTKQLILEPEAQEIEIPLETKDDLKVIQKGLEDRAEYTPHIGNLKTSKNEQVPDAFRTSHELATIKKQAADTVDSAVREAERTASDNLSASSQFQEIDTKASLETIETPKSIIEKHIEITSQPMEGSSTTTVIQKITMTRLSSGDGVEGDNIIKTGLSGKTNEVSTLEGKEDTNVDEARASKYTHRVTDGGKYEEDRSSITDIVLSATPAVSESIHEISSRGVSAVEKAVDTISLPVLEGGASIVQKSTTVTTRSLDSAKDDRALKKDVAKEAATIAGKTKDAQKDDQNALKKEAENVKKEFDAPNNLMQSSGKDLIGSKSIIGTLDESGRTLTETVKTSSDDSVRIIDKTLAGASQALKKGAIETTKSEIVRELEDGLQIFDKTMLATLEKGKEKLEDVKQTVDDQKKKKTFDAECLRKSLHDAIGSSEQDFHKTSHLIEESLEDGTRRVTKTIMKSTDEGVTVTGKIMETTTKPVEVMVERTMADIIELDIGLTEEIKDSLGGNVMDETLAGSGYIQRPFQDRNVEERLVIKEIPDDSNDRTQFATGSQVEVSRKDVKLPTIETFRPEFHPQISKLSGFESLETSSLGDKTSSSASSTDEIGRIIKEMESQLLKSKYEIDESGTEESSEVDEDLARESWTMPATPMPARRGLSSDHKDSSEGEHSDSQPVVTTPTLSRRVTGIGGSQRLTLAERPVVRVITEYVDDQNESEPEDSTYTVLEPEVRERRKFKIKFSPDMYESEEKDDTDIIEIPEPEASLVGENDSKKAEKKVRHIDRTFERMTSQTKEADPSMTEVTNSEFQRMVSQLSLEDMDQALHQWDMGGLTPSEVDSKDLTLSSEETTSPLQQGLNEIFRPKLPSVLPARISLEKSEPDIRSSNTSESTQIKLPTVEGRKPSAFQSSEMGNKDREGSHTLEPEETGETPPIPPPRTPLRLTDTQEPSTDQIDEPLKKDDDDTKNYASRKMFWEQMSSGSTETPPCAPDATPPVPKPRARSSLSQSIDIPEENKPEGHSEASSLQEASEIGQLQDLRGITTTDSVVRGLTKERTFSADGDTNSEVEFLRTHNKEDVSYDNDAFDDDTPQHSPFPEPKQRKTIYERSVSLPGDSTIETASSVRAKKKIFEAQIKKEMVVEHLISQMEEEGSPERKSFDLKDQEPADQAAMLNRQIHSEIVSHELEEQIESNLLETKDLVETKVERIDEKSKTEDETSESEKTTSDIQSIYETQISTTVAEVLTYKTEAISKPSDSLEVHVDKSELEDTEKVKEIEEELKVIDEKYESHQLPVSDQAKVSSITSSQGESEDTFSESDVTPEDARFKEQQDIQVWGPAEKEAKLGIDKTEEQKRQRSVHTPEEHIPDTVWEVPVQESIDSVETETVGQLSLLPKNENMTETEARKIAEIFVEEIESELKVGDVYHEVESKIVSEKAETSKRSEQVLKLIRTDTTTSSMEITDEDLRSSGMTDNSPLESQVGQIGDQGDVFGEDSEDDVEEVDRETIVKEFVDKTLAEVKQSLEAVKEELIEEKKKKRDSITKESPSEFVFRVLPVDKTCSESIQEHLQEEATMSESKVHTSTRESHFSEFQTPEVSETVKTTKSVTRTEISSELSQMSTQNYFKQDKLEERQQTTQISMERSDMTTKSKSPKGESFEGNVALEESKVLHSLTESEVSVDSGSSKDTVIEQEIATQMDEATTKSMTTKSTKHDSDSAGEFTAENEERKSPLEDVFSTSSSSDYKGGSNEASALEKPTIVIRKHKKSSLKDPKSDGEVYSSSGSHYESFEQTSESIRTPGSRPLSSDIEGLVPHVAGMTTGSSEYESAMSHEISGQSTTITSKDYQTAVSSLSSRDSMKSLDSESSGNLASIEVSSEASETLVPSAMELEKDSEEPVRKRAQMPLPPTEEQVKIQSFSESIEQSVSFDISEEISEDDDDAQVPAEVAACMKRSHEMTFQPEPRPIVLEEESLQTLNTSLDDMSSLVSSNTDTGAMKTVRELSKTESERMDSSNTSEQLSLTVSATSDVLSLSESKEHEETTVISNVETIATQSLPTQHSSGTVQSVTITTSSIIEHGIQSVCTQVTSKVEPQGTRHSNGPTQVDYVAEYDEGEHEVKKRGHRRNGSTSFRPSMIPVFHGREVRKKSEDIVEDSAESDKYTQPLTVKEGTHEEKKDIDETEKLDEESYKTEADQAMNRDLREGRISMGDGADRSISMDSTSMSSKSRLPSTAFSEADSEIAELLKQCSTDIPSEDPIERPKTPEPVEECELKDDTPEFSSEAQASVTELEMEYCGAFSRSIEYAEHVSPIREKELPTQESWEHIGNEQVYDSFVHSPDPLQLGLSDVVSEKHELETQEVTSKDKSLDRSRSPVPDITVTHHHPASCPTPQDSFEKIEADPEATKHDDSKQEGSSGNEIDKTGEDLKDGDAASESPTSDSFELLEKPDLADEFVIIEEVGKEASEQDTEGKSVRIDRKRATPRPATTSAPPPIESPPPTVTKMTQIKYFSTGATEEEIPFDFESGSPAKSTKSEKESSQEGSPPSADEPEFKPELEASKKWMEMQFQGEPVAQIFGYDLDYERGPLEDIKEEDINELEGSMNSKIGSMGSQVSQSIGSYGSVTSSTPDYDVLAGRKYFTRSGEHDDISMNSLQEFERLEHLLAMESGKHSKSLGSQDSLTSSSNSRKHGSRSGGDDVSLASLKEFEGLESACIAAEKIEKKAKEEESLLSEIEEGHESQASESESCVTISAMQRGESDEDDYERRMFEIDEIIRQAQTNVEQFMDSKSREMLEGGLKSETLGRADSLEEISKVPELDLDQPIVSYSSGKSYIQQWDDLGDDLVTSTDSLELKTQKSKTSIVDPFTTSTDSLEVKISQDVLSVSTDSIEVAQKAKKKDIMTDSIEVGEKSSMITSADSLEGKVTQANSIDDDELHATGIYDQSSSSGKEGDFSSSGKEDSAEGAVGITNRMPPPRAEYLLGSTDSLEPTSSTATHATYQYETDSVMSSSFTSGDSTTMVDDNDEEGAARASMWFDEGKPYVTEVIEPIIGDDEFSHVVHRKVEMPPEIHKVSFKGLEAEAALREYIEKFDPGEDCTETREIDEHGNVHVKRVIQKRVIVRPDDFGGKTTDLSGPELEKYIQTLTHSQLETEPPLETIHTESHSTVTTLRTATSTLTQGETIITEQEPKTMEPSSRGSRPPLKYDISVDEEPDFDPREHDWRFNLPTHLEHDEDTQQGATGYTDSKAKGSMPDKLSKK